MGYAVPRDSDDSPCECEHNNPDSLAARLVPSVVLAVAPAATMDEASSLSLYLWSFFVHGQTGRASFTRVQSTGE